MNYTAIVNTLPNNDLWVMTWNRERTNKRSIWIKPVYDQYESHLSHLMTIQNGQQTQANVFMSTTMSS